jgi:tRNA modification GTPase
MMSFRSAQAETIVALSSGQGRSAVAVIRVSGPHVRFVVETIIRKSLHERVAHLVVIRDPADGSVIDRALALFFSGPHSATGEDVLELHVHGSPAVIEAVLHAAQAAHPMIRLAEPGEFSRRSLENGKLDLLQVEALGDLLAASSRGQLRQAQHLLGGDLGRRAGRWRQSLVSLQALVEAELDFSNEGDVAGSYLDEVRAGIMMVRAEVEEVLGHAARGIRMAEGAVVVICGAPNVGKSSLLNALVGRDMAIVSAQPGTTRDLIEVQLVIDGWPVCLIDSAGLRSSDDPIEAEGIERARRRALEADVVLLLSSRDVGAPQLSYGGLVIRVGTKLDMAGQASVDVNVSARTGAGLDELRRLISTALRDVLDGEPASLSRERQRQALADCLNALDGGYGSIAPELVAESLRSANAALGRLLGQSDYESVLDELFAGFCIGK